MAGKVNKSKNVGQTVVARRQWNHWMQGTVKIEDIDGLHWDDYSGGVCSRAPRPFIHGYVSCDAFIEGEVAHSCAHGEGPHNIKVCIVKKDNDPEIFKFLKEWAN